MLVKATFPVLLTTYLHVTVEPKLILGPLDASASTPFVATSISIEGAGFRGTVHSPILGTKAVSGTIRS